MLQEYRTQFLYPRAFNKPGTDYNLTNTKVTTTQLILQSTVVEGQRKGNYRMKDQSS